jgi:hypothetical protein
MIDGQRRYAIGFVLLAICAELLVACGSPATPSASNSATSTGCRQVRAVLSDGPDPGADPMGYAEAQIHPLRATVTSDSGLRAAIDNLASAFEELFSTGLSQAAKLAVSRAESRMNAICPGVAP